MPRSVPGPGGFEATGRAAIARIGIALLLTLSACARSGPPPQDAFVVMADEVFGAGYTHISERYVEPVSMSDVALAGMAAIDKIDDHLHVLRRGADIVLTSDGTTIRVFPAPQDEDPVAWANLTTEVLESGREASPLLRDADPERIYEVVFGGALSGLDPFSRYASAAVAREQRAQRDGFGGIGITIKLAEDQLRVESVVEDSPAAKAGIKADSAILEINGQPTTGLSLEDAVDRLRGTVGSSLSLVVAAPGDPHRREVSLRRALIVPPTVTYARYGNIAYFRISSFNQRTTSSLSHAMKQALRDMGPALRGAVLDLRGNPGGLLDQAVTVSDLFLTHGRILSTSGRHPDSNQIFDAAGTDLLHGLPVAVLVNGGTASAAEVVAAALQDEGRAIVVGSASYGKGTVQTVHRLPNDGEIIITWSRIMAPSGYGLNHLGVIPTICTSKAEADTPEAVSAVLDEVKTGRLETAAARSALRANGAPSRAEIRLLRASCPPRNGDSKVDLTVAEDLIEDGNLFAHALGPSSSEIAKRP
ncbi:MAG TPA: S41 family peptidase [Alphaproteobacteria bacterium]|nr:S41 family peptidase [Alphaproteobacteria bacterium]